MPRTMADTVPPEYNFKALQRDQNIAHERYLAVKWYCTDITSITCVVSERKASSSLATKLTVYCRTRCLLLNIKLGFCRRCVVLLRTALCQVKEQQNLMLYKATYGNSVIRTEKEKRRMSSEKRKDCCVINGKTESDN